MRKCDAHNSPTRRSTRKPTTRAMASNATIKLDSESSHLSHPPVFPSFFSHRRLSEKKKYSTLRQTLSFFEANTRNTQFLHPKFAKFCRHINKMQEEKPFFGGGWCSGVVPFDAGCHTALLLSCFRHKNANLRRIRRRDGLLVFRKNLNYARCTVPIPVEDMQ